MKNCRNRVLIVTPVFTHPPTQGNASRILAFGRELKARGFIVDVVFFALDYGHHEGLAAMREEWNEVTVVNAVPPAKRSYPGHWGIDDWCPDVLVDTVGSLCGKELYTAVIVNYVWLSRALEAVDGPIKVIDTHDVFGDRHLMCVDAGIDPNWFFTSPLLESGGFDRADIVIAIQKAEAAAIAARTRAQTLIVGHQMEPSYLLMDQTRLPVSEFGYLSSANPWNVTSAYILDDHLSREYPDCDWILAGGLSSIGERIRTAKGVLGKVDLLEDFYSIVSCCINPMISGSGLKLKTIEALAFGRPVICTKAGSDGLDVRHPFHALPDGASMAIAMRDYSTSPTLRRELLDASRLLFIEYSLETSRQFDRFTTALVMN